MTVLCLAKYGMKTAAYQDTPDTFIHCQNSIGVQFGLDKVILVRILPDMSEEHVVKPSIVEELLLCRSVYSIAFEAAMQILELSQGFPRGGPQSIHAQIIQLSSNVCENLTKAWQNRGTPGIFSDKLNAATVSASRTQAQVEAAQHAGLINAETALQLMSKYDEVLEKISGMIKENS